MKASLKDGDDLCFVMQQIARASAGKEEDAVYKALDSSGLLPSIPTTILNLGPDLPDFPCFCPRDLIESLAGRGCMDQIIGHPFNTCALDSLGML